MFSSFFKSKFSAKAQQQELSQPTASTHEQILQALANYRSPSFIKGILAVASEVELNLQDKCWRLSLTLPYACQDEITQCVAQISDAIAQSIKVALTYDIHAVRRHSIEGVKNIIAISSGKGGVGKSTTAVNIALALKQQGATVGLLDADIYGPSIPLMLGLQGQRPVSNDGKKLLPLKAHGLQAMSIGFLTAVDDATVWRGPMASTAFQQLLMETQWHNIDYLIVDMPPGTGDIQLTLAQKVPVVAAVIITTPQSVALADADKGIAMFEKVQVPILGLVENMSYHICAHCGHQSHLFGCNGGQRIAEKHQTLLLGQLPLTEAIGQYADQGDSLIDNLPNSDISQQYRKIAQLIASECFYQFDKRSPLNPTIEKVELSS
jgi:ATP-binding protein involved in chromosome partitioning